MLSAIADVFQIGFFLFLFFMAIGVLTKLAHLAKFFAVAYREANPLDEEVRKKRIEELLKNG